MRLVPALVWSLEGEAVEVLDARLLPLLRAIAASASLAAAVVECRISYRAAWGLLREYQRKLGKPLVQLERGRGAKLTPLGERLIGAERTAARRLARTLHDLAVELGPYLARTPSTPALATLHELTDPEFTPGRPVADAASGLCHRIFTTFVFDAGFSDVTTPLADVLAARRGVCQDFAHIACAALRSVGLPARYVSGYIETLPPPGQPKLVGVDASHAWCAV